MEIKYILLILFSLLCGIVFILIIKDKLEYKEPKVEKIVEKIVVGYDILEYPSSYNIICEEGISIKDYGTGIKYIYSCLESELGLCAGKGKICLIDNRMD